MVVQLTLDDNLQNRIERLALARQRSAEGMTLEAIRHYVAREEARDTFAAEAEASWATFQETGLQLSGDEVRNWLQTWGEEDEMALPACHD